MKINSKDYRVQTGIEVNLNEWPTLAKPFCMSKKQYQKLLEEHAGELKKLQRLHYASSRYALLLIFQGMDASGKDGSIRHVMSGVNPQGCEVFSFKQPSAEELKHDFLWRTTCRLPERGRIGIFFMGRILVRLDDFCLSEVKFCLTRFNTKKKSQNSRLKLLLD
jgi:polyphosphate kinase 2 (PPK2 family)